MIGFRTPRVRILAFTPLAPDLKLRQRALGWFECSVNGQPGVHVVAYREPDGRLGVLSPPPPLTAELPDWVRHYVGRKVKRFIRRQIRGAS